MARDVALETRALGTVTASQISHGRENDLFIEVEEDRTVYGDEVKFGGGKVIRDGMGQSQRTRAEGAVDTVITNALIVDWTGIYKADVGLKDGRIAKIGKAGNPDTQPGGDIVVGPGTEGIAAEGRILTAGAFDIISWTYDFYGTHRDFELDRAAIDAVDGNKPTWTVLQGFDWRRWPMTRSRRSKSCPST